jgi:hypothetical protein
MCFELMSQRVDELKSQSGLCVLTFVFDGCVMSNFKLTPLSLIIDH